MVAVPHRVDRSCLAIKPNDQAAQAAQACPDSRGWDGETRSVAVFLGSGELTLLVFDASIVPFDLKSFCHLFPQVVIQGKPFVYFQPSTLVVSHPGRIFTRRGIASVSPKPTPTKPIFSPPPLVLLKPKAPRHDPQGSENTGTNLSNSHGHEASANTTFRPSGPHCTRFGSRYGYCGSNRYGRLFITTSVPGRPVGNGGEGSNGIYSL